MKPFSIAIVTLAVLVCNLWTAAQTPVPKYVGQWQIISDGILAELAKDNPKPRSEYERAAAGIGVDRTNGDVYLMANNIGICKSTDQGKTFSLVSGKNVTGRFEYGWGIDIDPAGKRLMCFSIYGSSAYSDDAGMTWTKSTMNHLDYGAVDWADTGKAFLAIGHESGGKLMYSSDTGKQWKVLGQGFSAAGLFDAGTLMSFSKAEGLVRSIDGGKSWAKVSDRKLAAPVMVVFTNIGYWLGEDGLLVSKDKGATWTIVAPLPKGACLGPMLGADENHMMVGCQEGLYESTDGGKTWTFAVPLAPQIKILKYGQFGNYAWDPIHDIFYASKMGQPAYQYIAHK